MILVINQLNAKKSCFIRSLLYSSTCFEHYVLIIRRSKLYYTASGIIKLKQVRCCFSVMIPDAAKYNFDHLMMSTYCSKHVEVYNKLLIKQDFVNLFG